MPHSPAWPLTDDPRMAVRIVTYVGLLYQDLIKRREVTAGERLPPVFPAVIYNGAKRWTSARELAELIEACAGGLSRYQPRRRYFVLDEGDEEAVEADNTFGAIVALETGPAPEELARVVARLARRLQAPENRELRRALAVWIHRVVLERLVPGEAIPAVDELTEIESMLAERVVEWTEKWKQQGIEQGLEQGIEQGKRLGRLEGEATVLARQLARRFGPLSAETRARLQQASSEQLEQWAENILDARTLGEVFAPPR